MRSPPQRPPPAPGPGGPPPAPGPSSPPPPQRERLPLKGPRSEAAAHIYMYRRIEHRWSVYKGGLVCLVSCMLRHSPGAPASSSTRPDGSDQQTIRGTAKTSRPPFSFKPDTQNKAPIMTCVYTYVYEKPDLVGLFFVGRDDRYGVQRLL